jgi:uncharacterized DUF497 family protein
MVPIRQLRWDQETIAKLGSKHGVSVTEVEDACYWDNGATARWDVDPVRGRRLLVKGRTESGRQLRIILRPTDAPGQFDVLSAYE